MAWDLIIWADKRALEKAGSLLETPQKLGIWPTWSFWNRRDVWQRARWFVAPAAGVTVSTCMVLTFVLRLPMWAAPATGFIGGGLITLWMGGLERLIRKRIKERKQQARELEAREALLEAAEELDDLDRSMPKP
jgi:hypothetical protein